MSEFFEIEGGTKLEGEITASGAKNAALPQLIASLLTEDKCTFSRVPKLKDIYLLFKLLENLGAEIDTTKFKDSNLGIKVPTFKSLEASYSLVKSLRASFWVLAPLLARAGTCRVALPGGDIIGARPVDMHLTALVEMGAEIQIKQGVVFAAAKKGLKPAKLSLKFPSVGATHQILMAAALTKGTTTLSGAAKEPEVVALANMLDNMGAKIEGAGTDKIIIEGTEKLKGVHVNLIGDRIEAGTYILAAIASKGSVKVNGIAPEFLGEFLNLLESAGVVVERGSNSIGVKVSKELNSLKIQTGPFPAFPTDLQSPMMALMSTIKGENSIEEKVFEGRFSNVSELCRMGADIHVSEQVATINGVESLSAAPVEALDIRSGAALIIAALSANGKTQIYEVDHIRRGYEDLEGKIKKLGGKISLKNIDSEDFLFVGC